LIFSSTPVTFNASSAFDRQELALTFYFRIREKLRFNPLVQRAFYTAESLRYSIHSNLSSQIVRRAALLSGPGRGVAVCARIKDEAPVLDEWLKYHMLAGVSHFFLYESFSSDDFREVLRPWVERGCVTLLADWPTVPVTPYAEKDCILRCLNRFEWVGFLDVDEFLVLRDGSSIGDFLARYRESPGVAFHWMLFGSNYHIQPPADSIIRAYTRRAAQPNQHVKVFVRPEQVTHCRNPHSCQYKGLRHAVTEAGAAVYGSFLVHPVVRDGWIAHFHCKSEAEYMAKIRKQEACDRVAMKFQRRTEESRRKLLVESNAVEDLSVQTYYGQRCASLGVPPTLLLDNQSRDDQAFSALPV
jgi:hypothetical protein